MFVPNRLARWWKISDPCGTQDQLFGARPREGVFLVMGPRAPAFHDLRRCGAGDLSNTPIAPFPAFFCTPLWKRLVRRPKWCRQPALERFLRAIRALKIQRSALSSFASGWSNYPSARRQARCRAGFRRQPPGRIARHEPDPVKTRRGRPKDTDSRKLTDSAARPVGPDKALDAPRFLSRKT